jgi:hypothetical protein
MPNGFLFDGCERAQAAVRLAIREQVTAEYAEAFATASFWDRLRLWREIEREVARRVNKLAPPDALY